MTILIKEWTHHQGKPQNDVSNFFMFNFVGACIARPDDRCSPLRNAIFVTTKQAEDSACFLFIRALLASRCQARAYKCL